MRLFDPILVRRLVLGGSGLVFPTIAVLAIFMPREVAAQYGLTLDGVESYNQFRAVFIGFWLGLGATMITAARRPDLVILGDLCGWMLTLQALGRGLSLVLDGIPRWQFVAASAGELAAGLIVLSLRPRGEAVGVARGMGG